MGCGVLKACGGLRRFAIVAVNFTGYFRFFEPEFDMSNKL
jgi:hypothetical protein